MIAAHARSQTGNAPAAAPAIDDAAVLRRRLIGTAPSPLGFGVSGPLASPLMSDAAVIDLIHQALKRGVPVFDTAPFYGAGRAERRLGRALATAPAPLADAAQTAFVSTKIGTVWRAGKPHKDFSPDGARQSLAASRARLGRTRIDAVFVHGAPPAAALEPLLTALQDERAAGHLDWIGWCGRGPELDPLIARGAGDGVQLLMGPAHCRLDAPQRARLLRARRRGFVLFGVETLAPLARRWRWPRQPADLWRLAKTLSGRATVAVEPADVTQCWRWASGPDGPDVALTTTTRPGHLAASVELAACRQTSAANTP